MIKQFFLLVLKFFTFFMNLDPRLQPLVSLINVETMSNRVVSLTQLWQWAAQQGSFDLIR